MPKTVVSILIVLALLPACDRSQKAAPSGAAASVARGRSIYQTQCIACHHSDPNKAGSIGPDVFGSSKELLAARILRGEYPPGYQPKRTTRMMAPLPALTNEIDSLHLYLNTKP